MAQEHIRLVRFGHYEVNLESGELRKNGHKLSVPAQAIQVLTMLLERRGDLVTREQLMLACGRTGLLLSSITESIPASGVSGQP